MQFSIPVILAMLQAAITVAPQILSTIDQLKDIGTKLFATLNGREPTQAEQDELQAQIVILFLARLLIPIGGHARLF